MKPSTKLALAAVAVAAVAPPARPQPQPQPPAQTAQQRQTGDQPTAAGRLVVLYFDTASLTTEDLGRAAASTEKFVQAQMKPDDKVAVMFGIKVRQDFTNDHDLLIKAIRLLNDLPAPGISETPVSGEAAAKQASLRFAELETAFKMLGVLPGKKALIYITDGLAASAGQQVQLQAAINAAMRANVSIFPIDARGLIETIR